MAVHSKGGIFELCTFHARSSFVQLCLTFAFDHSELFLITSSFNFLSGDNLIVGSYDRRLCWFDMDLSTKPYKTLR